MLINALLFFIHYRDSSIITDKKEQKNSYHQEIEVIHRANELLVRHHFTNLSTNRLEIRWPKISEDRTCHVEDRTSCMRLNEEATAFIEGEETAQSISYTIPKEVTATEQIFLQSVFAEIHQAEPKATVLHLIDEVESDGLWVTGLQQVGNQTLNLVNYTLFSGDGPVSDLYWQSQQPTHQSNEYVTVYGADSLAGVEEYERLFQTLAFSHTAIVINEQAKSTDSSRFIVTKSSELHKMLQQFAMNQFNLQYADGNIDHFTSEVLTALLLEEENVDLSLASTAVKELQDSLTAAQITQFVTKVTEAEKIESAKMIDEIMEEVSGYKTSFFSTNSQLEEGYYPFLLENPKKIVVSNGDSLHNHAIVKDNRTYYPITEIMEAFGYDVTVRNKSLYVESVDQSYRFPLESHFYVFNNRRFNTQEIVVKQMNGLLYVEEATMLRIFQINMASTNDKINLMPITS